MPGWLRWPLRIVVTLLGLGVAGAAAIAMPAINAIAAAPATPRPSNVTTMRSGQRSQPGIVVVRPSEDGSPADRLSALSDSVTSLPASRPHYRNWRRSRRLAGTVSGPGRRLRRGRPGCLSQHVCQRSFACEICNVHAPCARDFALVIKGFTASIEVTY